MSDDQIQWLCHQCSAPIENATGYLAMDVEALRSYEVDPGNTDGAATPVTDETLEALADSPEQLQWLAFHTTCGEESSLAGPYVIPIEEVRTPRGLLSWTGQLGEKPWLRSTDWFDLLLQIAQAPADAAAADVDMEADLGVAAP